MLYNVVVEDKRIMNATKTKYQNSIELDLTEEQVEHIRDVSYSKFPFYIYDKEIGVDEKEKKKYLKEVADEEHKKDNKYDMEVILEDLIDMFPEEKHTSEMKKFKNSKKGGK